LSKTDAYPENITYVRRTIDVKPYLDAGYTPEDIDNALNLLTNAHDDISAFWDPWTPEFVTTLKYSFPRGNGKSIVPIFNACIVSARAHRELTCRLSEDGQVELKPAFLIDMERRVLEETFKWPLFTDTDFRTKYQQIPVDCSKYIIKEEEDE
jgi:hypothetical protein